MNRSSVKSGRSSCNNRHTTYIKSEVDAALTKPELQRVAAIQDRRVVNGDWDIGFYDEWTVDELRTHTAR